VSAVPVAIAAGTNLLDTGDSYGMGHSEMLIRKAIAGRRQAGFHRQESEN
jgi:aryl-alcohol dehydrogenase-like predicted oxidoreductase